jgi:hypothetical protein
MGPSAEVTLARMTSGARFCIDHFYIENATVLDEPRGVNVVGRDVAKAN